ncbi:MAG TPA: metallophosphoesterase [Pyrinomonadaceae bacterium]|jgi:predicted MPP superfamily phosphohydrolase|nr:metallophosphoesterase [Pyrinomonadaceae bacterium]
MNIVIIQLSDIHFIDGKNLVVDRASDIAHAVQPTLSSATACFIVITGDIAFSGTATQYEIAQQFLAQLKELVLSQNPTLVFNFIAVPGNHDCDFKKDTALRAVMLKSGEQILEQLNPEDDSIVQALVAVQDNFFNFLANLESNNTHLTINNATTSLIGYDRIHYKREFEIGEYRLRFNCYNTAWVSQLHEQQSQLFFPIGIITPDETKCDVVVAAFHHPTQWLESNNARKFRGQVEPASDIILTGHEHIADQYTKHHPLSGEISLYVEGAVLQEGSKSESGFNVLELDLSTKRKRLTEYTWHKDIYVPNRAGEWSAFERSRGLAVREFQNNEHYNKILSDPGANFTHPSNKSLTLQDIFIYPELALLPLENKPDEKTVLSIIDSEQVFKFVLDNPLFVITAPEVAGKTALARKLYLDLQKQRLVPIMLHGSEIKTPSAEDFNKLIDRHFAEQYSPDDVVRYQQLERKRKALIIDDFHRVQRLNRKGKNSVLEAASKSFERIIILANDLFPFEEITQQVEEQSALISYTHAEISEFGHRLRYQLITKWVSFGQEYTGDEEDISQRIKETANIVKTLLGRKMVPSYPIFVLSMLQVLEANANLNTASGAYGYFYEVIIIQSLSIHRTQAIPMDMLTTYITLIAYEIFKSKQHYLNEEDLDEVTNRYFSDYGIRFNRETMLRILENSKILLHKGNEYRFNYKYVYYYFVAKYLATNLNTKGQQKAIRQWITRMASNLYVEDYANIVIFLVYLTKDEKTIIQILEQAKTLYAEYDPFNLDSHVDFANRLQLEAPRPLLLDGDTQANRDNYLREMDEVERSLERTEDLKEDDDLQLEREMNDLVRLNVASKTLQIMGQILRNFPGALRREQKLELATECNQLGLRTIKVIFDAIEENTDFLRLHIGEFLREIDKSIKEENLAHKVDRLFFGLMGVVAYGFMRRTAQAIGSEHLKETYQEVLNENPMNSTKLIDLMIKLEHFRPFPEKEVLDLDLQLQNNNLALTILRHIVRDYFHLHKEGYQLRQKICDKIGIQFRDQRMIESKSKL